MASEVLTFVGMRLQWHGPDSRALLPTKAANEGLVFLSNIVGFLVKMP